MRERGQEGEHEGERESRRERESFWMARNSSQIVTVTPPSEYFLLHLVSIRMASGGQKTLICPLTIFALSLLGFLPRGLCPSVVTLGSQTTLRCLSETVEGGCLTPRSSHCRFEA